MRNDISNVSRVLELPEGGSVRLHGAFDVQDIVIGDVRGLRPIRLPESSFVQFAPYERESMRTVISGCSGVHLRVETEATSVALKVRCFRVDYGELKSTANGFVACVDGKTVSEVESSVDFIEHVEGRDGRTSVSEKVKESSTVVFDGLPAGRKTVTIWLPQTMMVDLIGIQGADGEPVEAAADSMSPRWLHYGSSISHCHTPALPTQVWPVIVSEKNGLELTNLGFAGQCMLDPYVARAVAASDADVITMSVGVNITGARTMNQRTFVPALHGFLDIVREKHPTTPIVLMSSIYWPESDDVPGPADVRFNDDGSVTCYCYGDKKDIPLGALTLEESRNELRELVQTRREAYGEPLYYVDGLTMFGPSDVNDYTLPDGLHPDARLYAEIARRFSASVFGEDGLVPASSLK